MSQLVGSQAERQFALWRILFGLYLTYYLLRLIPYSEMLYSNQGIPGGSRASDGVWNLLAYASSPQIVFSLNVIAAAFAVSLAVGFGRRVSAIVVWYALVCFYNRNPLTQSPELPFTGWLLIATLFVPRETRFLLFGRTSSNGEWTPPRLLVWGAGVVLAVAYSYSGYTKLMTPSWLNGQALYLFITAPPGYPWAGNFVTHLPFGLLKIASIAFVWLELLAPLFLFSTRLRWWGWWLFFVVHVMNLLVFDLTEVSLGMIMFHLFIAALFSKMPDLKRVAWHLFWRYPRRCQDLDRSRVSISDIRSGGSV